MKNILIVDDETFVRISIKTCIDWKSNGFNEPLQAGNGIEAIKIIDTENIDVVLTDIKMPEMGGLELVNEIRQKNLAMEIIMLSCYNDFEFVKQALKLGACDYLFKPAMLPEDIAKAIKKAADNIDKREKIDNEICILQKKVQEYLPKLKEVTLLHLINGEELKSENLTNKLHEIGIKTSPSNIDLMVVKLDYVDRMLEEEFQGNRHLFGFSVIKSITSILDNYENTELLFKDTEQYIVILFNYELSNKLRERAQKIAEQIIERLEEELHLTATVGVHSSKCGIEAISGLYKEANSFLDKRFFIGLRKVIFYEDASQYKNINNNEINKLLEKIYKEDEGLTPGKIREVFDKIKSDRTFTVKSVYEISSNIIGLFLKDAQKYDGLVEYIYEKEKDIYSKAYKFNSIYDIEEFIVNIAVELQNKISKVYPYEINEAIKYMKANLGDKTMSLDSISRHINISRNYLSFLFKQITGDKLINYLTKLRIERAEELYRKTDLKIYEIAENVGYSDWRYFSKVYKTYTGRQLSNLDK